MRHYETAFLITPKLEEDETEKLIEKMAEVVKKKKGKMVNIEKWGKRRLAYPIDKLEEAVYVFFHYEGDPEIPFELQRRFRQTEAIIRYLTLKKEKFIPPRKKTKPEKKESQRDVEAKQKEKKEQPEESLEARPESEEAKIEEKETETPEVEETTKEEK